MPPPVIQTSFSSGELSPFLFGRVDLAKYKTGAAKLENFIVDYKGGAGKRAGTKFVGVSPYWNGEVIFVKFEFNVDQTYILEFGHGYMRVITNGGYVLDGNGNIYQIGTPYNHLDLRLLKWTQSGDTLTFVHQLYPIYEIVRYGHTDWRLQWVSFGSVTQPPGGVYLVAQATGLIDAASAAYCNYGYAVTAVGDDGTESALSAIAHLDNTLDMTAHKVSITAFWGQSGVNIDYYNVYKATTGIGAQISNGTRMGFLGSTKATSFTDSNILPNYTRGPPQHSDPFSPGQIIDVIMTDGASGYDQSAYFNVYDPTGGGFSGSPVSAFGGIHSVIINNGGAYYTAPQVFFSGSPNGTVATGVAVLGPQTGTFPGAIAYFQQRLLFAGTINKPSTLWGSKPGAFKNFDASIPISDADSFDFTLASQQLNAIKYMLPMPGGLVILTSGSVWQLSGTQQYAPVTPTQVMATPQASNGCGDLTPIVIGYEILFVQSAGSVVRNLSYNFFANIYTGTDVTVLSSHLFTNYTLKNWAYAEEPDKIVWCTRDDGTLLSLTFLKEQEVSGWARHITAGKVKAVGSVREGNRDVVYLAVDRILPNGNRFTAIEQMQPRSSRTIDNSWYLDCALSTILYTGTDWLNSGSLSNPNSVVLTAQTAPPFSSAWVGDIVYAAGGKFQITSVLNTSQVITKQLIAPTDTFWVEESQTKYINPQPVGTWKVGAVYSSVSGLSHLEGCTVSVFADGKMQSDKVVVNGKITLDTPATRIIVGLGYVADLQTLRLESQPTIQTRRKKLPFLTLRVADTQGLSAGRTFNTLTDIKEIKPSVLNAAPTSLFTGDLRLALDPLYDDDGGLCIRSTHGLPANILAVIPEVVMGDD